MVLVVLNRFYRFIKYIETYKYFKLKDLNKIYIQKYSCPGYGTGCIKQVPFDILNILKPTKYFKVKDLNKIYIVKYSCPVFGAG